MEGFEGVDLCFGAADFPAVHAAFDLAGGEVEEGEAVVFVGGEGGLEIEAGGGEGRGAAGGGGPAEGAGGEGAGEDGVDGVGAEVVGAVAGRRPWSSRTSGYHSPHLPAVQAMGMEGTLTTWRAGERAMRRVSQFSTFSGTRSAWGPLRDWKRRQS